MLWLALQVKEGKWVPGRAVQYYDVAGYLVGRPAGAFTLFITIISLMSTSKHPSLLMHSSEQLCPMPASTPESESDSP